jgi:hypothetical protein
MNKLFLILLFILSSCCGLNKNVEPISETNNNIDSMMILADDAIIHLKHKKESHQNVQDKLNQKVLDIIYVRNFYKDSIDNLKSLKLVNRDSIIYNYNTELITIIDTIRVTISDSICPVCMNKINKRKSLFKIFKKKTKEKI